MLDLQSLENSYEAQISPRRVVPSGALSPWRLQVDFTQPTFVEVWGGSAKCNARGWRRGWWPPDRKGAHLQHQDPSRSVISAGSLFSDITRIQQVLLDCKACTVQTPPSHSKGPPPRYHQVLPQRSQGHRKENISITLYLGAIGSH